jgi:predicted oxidoreductase
MRTYTVAATGLQVSRIALGCMRLGGVWNEAPPGGEDRERTRRAVEAALEAGINLFDHADIYARGKSEQVFGETLRASPGLRERIVIVSKCGIRFPSEPVPSAPERYDFSREHVLRSVDGSLRRLQTDVLDVLLLHRPDPLAEPEEVARAFDELLAAGKVRYFGVSNHARGQIELLERHVRQPLVVHQVELSLGHLHLIDEGVVANQAAGRGALASGTLDYCRMRGILVQAWSPLGRGTFLAREGGAAPAGGSTAVLARIASEREASPEAVALAWLLRHPAGIQPVIGTTRPERIRACCQADALELSREEWYELFVAARGQPLP